MESRRSPRKNNYTNKSVYADRPKFNYDQSEKDFKDLSSGEDIAKKYRKKGKIVEDKKEINLSTDLSEALANVSDFDINNFDTNLDLLKALRLALAEAFKISQGSLRSKPSSSNAYALASLSRDLQMITKEIEESINYKDLADNIVEKVIEPHVNKQLLELGSMIHSVASEFDSVPGKKKVIYNALIKVYRQYAAHVESNAGSLKDKIVNEIVSNL